MKWRYVSISPGKVEPRKGWRLKQAEDEQRVQIALSVAAVLPVDVRQQPPKSVIKGEGIRLDKSVVTLLEKTRFSVG